MKFIRFQSIFLLGFIVCYGSASYVMARNMTDRIALSFNLGNWQPHSLNDEPRFETFGAAGATPFYSCALSFPLGRELAFQANFGYWSLMDLDEVESVHSLTLHPFTLNVKYWLIPDYRLSAYVLYGGGIYWGIENETDPFGEEFNQAMTGWGANLGAGIDLALGSRIGLGLSFQYNYVQFEKLLGGVEDFSGPQWAATLHYYLN